MGGQATSIGASEGRKSAPGASQASSEAAGKAAPRAAFAAISWLNFKHCAWPTHRAPPASEDELELELESGPLNLTDDDDDDGYYSDEDEDDDDDDDHWTGGAARQRPTKERKEAAVCPGGKFACASSALCIEPSKLCNFVDDCMSDSGSAAGTSSEDESPADVCRRVPGMENFEASPGAEVGASWWRAPPKRPPVWGAKNHVDELGLEAGLKQSPPSPPLSLSETSRFWSLAGNWPVDKISLQWAPINYAPTAAADGFPSRPEAAHLPRKDHTPSNKGRGHYLALEIPRRPPSPPSVVSQTAPSMAAAANRLIGNADDGQSKRNHQHWIYLESAWLTKKKKQPRKQSINGSSGLEAGGVQATNDDVGDDDCRVKFFYNFVSSAKKTSRLAQSLPFNLYLMVEHVVAPHPLDKQEATLKLDWLGSLRPTPMNDELKVIDGGAQQQRLSGGGLIEWPGVDFWREANHRLLGLHDNDIFYIRITLLVEHDADHVADGANTDQSLSSSFSFDDLSTHLGCSSEPLSETDLRKANRFRLDPREAPERLVEIVRQPIRVHADDSDTKKTFREEEASRHEPESSNVRHRNRRGRQTTTAVRSEPQRLILSVLVALSSMFGLIFMIVFIVVPRVERAVMNFHDQLLLSMNDDDDDDYDVGIPGYTPRNSIAIISRHDMMNPHSSSLDGCSSLTGGDICELTTNGSDWDHLTATTVGGAPWRFPSSPEAAAAARDNQYDESYLTGDSVASILDSDSYSQRLSSVGESFVVLQENHRGTKRSSATVKSGDDPDDDGDDDRTMKTTTSNNTSCSADDEDHL